MTRHIDVDNRNLEDMNKYLEDRVKALEAELQRLKRVAEVNEEIWRATIRHAERNEN
jgi:DNA-binding SARP family transcriptional activator